MGVHYLNTALRSATNTPVWLRISTPAALEEEVRGLFSSNAELSPERASYIVKHIHLDLVAYEPHGPSVELITSLPLGTAIAWATPSMTGGLPPQGVARLLTTYREERLYKEVPMRRLEHLALATIDADPKLYEAYKASPLSSFQKASEWDRWLGAGQPTLERTVPEGTSREIGQQMEEERRANERNAWIRENCTIS